MKRNCANIGRYVAIVVAIVLLSLVPLKYVAEEAALDTEHSIQTSITELTNRIGSAGSISLADYEELSAYLDSVGGNYDVGISIERPAESTAETACGHDHEHEINRALALELGIYQLASLTNVASHVHTPDCYAGHNHAASGCHLLAESCYCNGKFTVYSHHEDYWYDDPTYHSCSTTQKCGTCNGSGSVKVPNVTTCSKCGGAGGSSKQASSCQNREWHTCSKCGGSGEVNGKPCSRCSGGKDGGWYVCSHSGKYACNCSSSCSSCYPTTWKSCSSCGGSGSKTTYSNGTCGTCGGSGSVTCSTCNGNGYYYTYVRTKGSRAVYKCDRCGVGESSEQNGTCRRIVCGQTHCNLANDNNARCASVIVSASPVKQNQTIYYGEPETFNPKIKVTYLNGTTGQVTATVKTTIKPTDWSPQKITLAYTGYFGNARTYGTYTWDVNLQVVPKTRNCPYCLLDYDLNQDGSDPGCPVCHFTYESLRIAPTFVSLEPGATSLPISVTAVYIDQHTKTLTTSEWHDDCDFTTTGARMVGITARDDLGNDRTDYITVSIEKYYTCDTCGRTYKSASDGSDPGCPYCQNSIINIYAVLGKDTYNVDEVLEASVYAHYYNRDEMIANGEWAAVYDFSEAGEKTVVFYYEDYVCTAQVMVNNPYIVTCDICGNTYDTRHYDTCPHCRFDVVSITVYPVERQIVLGGTPRFLVYATTREGVTNIVDSGYTITGFNAFTTGDQTITAEYEGHTATCVITVVENAPGTVTVPEDDGASGGGTNHNPGGSGGGGGTSTPSPLGDNYLVCPNGHTYEKDSDGSDPGCPYCYFFNSTDNEDIDAIAGKTTEYASAQYTNEILEDLYSQYYAYISAGKSSSEAAKLATISLEKGDIVTVTVTRTKDTFVQKINKTFKNDYLGGSYSSSTIIGPAKAT